MIQKLTYILLCLLLTVNLSAQEYVTNFLNKYGTDKDLEVVNIGKQMLDMLGNMNVEDQELSETIKGLESIKIITSNSEENSPKYFKHILDLLNKKSQGFQELMSVKEDNEQICIMTRESDGIIKDFVLISETGDDFSMICLSGKINMNTLGKLAKNMNLSQLNKLNNTSNKNKIKIDN